MVVAAGDLVWAELLIREDLVWDIFYKGALEVLRGKWFFYDIGGNCGDHSRELVSMRGDNEVVLGGRKG